MPPKKRKFESTFPAARIKKIMQLDDDVGRVASSVPIVISRAVEMFLEALLTRANGYAMSRSAKTLTVGHIKHCIESEKQWDFLRDLTAKVPDISACNESEGSPKRGRKRKNSSSKVSDSTSTKRRRKKVEKAESNTDSGQDDAEETDSSSPGSSHSSQPAGTVSHPHPSAIEPSPLAILQKRLSGNSNPSTTPPTNQKPHPQIPVPPKVSTNSLGMGSSASPLMALASTLTSANKPPTLPHTTITSFTGSAHTQDDDDEYD